MAAANCLANNTGEKAVQVQYVLAPVSYLLASWRSRKSDNAFLVQSVLAPTSTVK